MAALLPRLLALLGLLATLYVLGLSAYQIQQARQSSSPLSRTVWSVSIISGCAALWCILALPLLLRPRLLLAVALLDSVFGSGMAAISILLRAHATTDCGGDRDCMLSKVAFAVSIAAASVPPPRLPLLPVPVENAVAKGWLNRVFFFVLAALAWYAHRVYRRNRAFGLGPTNAYSTATAATAPRSKRSSRWSGSSADGDAGSVAQTNGGTFTRHSARGHGHGGPHHQRETGDRGGFDSEQQQHHGEGVRGYQAF